MKNSIPLRIVLPVIWVLLIWVVSSVPSKELPVIRIIGYDKIAHLGVYAILGVLVNNCIKKWSSLLPILTIYAFLFLNASLDELHQQLIPGRSVSLWDLLANYCGLGLALLLLLKRK